MCPFLKADNLEDIEQDMITTKQYMQTFISTPPHKWWGYMTCYNHITFPPRNDLIHLSMNENAYRERHAHLASHTRIWFITTFSIMFEAFRYSDEYAT